MSENLTLENAEESSELNGDTNSYAIEKMLNNSEVHLNHKLENGNGVRDSSQMNGDVNAMERVNENAVKKVDINVKGNEDNASKLKEIMEKRAKIEDKISEQVVDKISDKVGNKNRDNLEENYSENVNDTDSKKLVDKNISKVDAHSVTLDAKNSEKLVDESREEMDAENSIKLDEKISDEINAINNNSNSFSEDNDKDSSEITPKSNVENSNSKDNSIINDVEMKDSENLSDNDDSSKESEQTKLDNSNEISEKTDLDKTLDVSSDDIDINNDKKESEVGLENSGEKSLDISTSDEKSAESSAKKKRKSPTKKPTILPAVKRVTRSASGISKQIKYSDQDLRILDEDDVKITKEVPKKGKKDAKNDGPEIEMIEQTDPLAISDVDMKKLIERKSIQIKTIKPKDLNALKVKNDNNLIIIKTNQVVKTTQPQSQSHSNQQSQPSSQIQHVQSLVAAPKQIVQAQSQGQPQSVHTVQSAIQAITGGIPAHQGLQSAYLNAIQQVLSAQGSAQISNPHYISTLQQYYQSLGAWHDDAFVIEAPSFIVPYVMEGKPVEKIKSYLTRKKLESEKEKLAKEMKAKKELEASKKNEEDEKKEKVDDDREKLEKEKVVEESKKSDEEKVEDMEVDETKDEKTEVEADKLKDKEGLDENDKKIDEKLDEKVDEEEETKSKKVDVEKDSKDKKVDADIDTKEEKAENDKDTNVEDKKDTVDAEKVDKKADEEMEIDEKNEKINKEEEVKDKEVDVEKEKKSDEVEDKKADVEKDKQVDEEKDKQVDTEKDKKVDTDADKKSEKSEAKNKEENKENKEDDVKVIGGHDYSHLGRWENYYKSALGQFFLELGLNQVQEFIQTDLLKMQKRKVDKKTAPTKQDYVAVKTTEAQLNATKRKNAHLAVVVKTCKFCSYKTESELALQKHLESPHMLHYTYKCNFCDFETRGPQIILYHIEAEHNVRGRLERAPAFFQCPLCPFEDNNKSKIARHTVSCGKKFRPEKNCDLFDWEPPAKIPKLLRGRPNQFAGKSMDSLRVASILPKNLGSFGVNLQNVLTGSLSQGANSIASLASTLAGKGRGRPIGSYKSISPSVGQGNSRSPQQGTLLLNRGGTLLQGVTSGQLNLANQVLQSANQAANRARLLSSGGSIPGLGSSSISIQSVQNKTGSTKSPQQPSISITPLPRGGSSSSSQSSPSNTKTSTTGSKPAFVICEICDGYIKDLEQLRNHMNLIHKVKIHPKMIYNRPPLNCQKCQHRFFTDQGLERHLLGTHGLVTSSMQEAANKGKDAGRCPICGKVFQWKLLNHVSRDHKMTLKPAHLSYKCTVCTATFNMYRLFENHVYSAHSVVNKNKNDSNSASGSSTSTGGSKKTSSANSDSAVKINDEITIIPQSGSNKDSEKQNKKGDSPTLNKEITITKVGSKSPKKGVEVISIDDSPQKRPAEEAAVAQPPKKRPRDAPPAKKANSPS